MSVRFFSHKRQARPRDAYAALARFGYGARGMVYLIIGFFALAAALGARARPAGSGDIFLALINRPIGVVLLAALAAGLLCFAGWRSLQAVKDIDRHGGSTRGLCAARSTARMRSSTSASRPGRLQWRWDGHIAPAASAKCTIGRRG